MAVPPRSQRFEIVIEIAPGHPNYPAKTSVSKPDALTQLQIIEANLRGSPLRCDYVGADNVLSLEMMETSRESTPFDFFRAVLDGAGSSSSPEISVETSPFRIKQELEPSLQRYLASPEEVYESPSTSPEKDLSKYEDLRFVRRSMLEVPKKRRWRPASFSLSVRAPGSLQREVLQMQEVPVLCKRLKIVHGQFNRTIELPQIMLTARRRSCSVSIKQELVPPLESRSYLTVGDSMLDTAMMDPALLLADAKPAPHETLWPELLNESKEHYTNQHRAQGTALATMSKAIRKKQRTYYKYPWWRLTKRLRPDLPRVPYPVEESFTILP